MGWYMGNIGGIGSLSCVVPIEVVCELGWDGPSLYFKTWAMYLKTGANYLSLSGSFSRIGEQVLWTFSIYLEAVAILPQLVLLQRTQNIDNLTGNYVFLLGWVNNSPLITFFLFVCGLIIWNLIAFDLCVRKKERNVTITRIKFHLGWAITVEEDGIWNFGKCNIDQDRLLAFFSYGLLVGYPITFCRTVFVSFPWSGHHNGWCPTLVLFFHQIF